MIYKKLVALLEEQFSVLPSAVLEDALLVEDLGLDLVELAMALEETFEVEEVEDLSNIETVEELIDFLQRELDM